MDLVPEIDVSALQAEALARGLYAVALVDGVHERELALITDFYQAAAAEGSSAGVLASLARVGPLEARDVAQLLIGPAHRELFMKAAFLLAWADGQVTAAERTKIGEFSTAFSVPTETVTRLEAEVKDFLLRPLAGLANVEAATAVAKKLGM